MNASPTATSARNRRSRSSSRCEISVPSASFSGSSLIGAARLCGSRGGGVGGGGRVAGGGVGGHRRRMAVGARCAGGRGGGWRLRRRGRGGALGLACLLELHFLLELLAELTRHGTGSSHPAADFGHHARQLLRSQHDQRQDEDDQD